MTRIDDRPSAPAGPPIRFGIRGKVALTFSALIVVIVLLFGTLSLRRLEAVFEVELRHTEQNVRESLRRKGLALVKDIAYAAEIALAGNDFAFLQRIIEVAREDTDVSYGSIIGTDRRVIFDSRPGIQGRMLGSPLDLAVLGVEEARAFEIPGHPGEEPRLEVAAPIRADSLRMGTLRFGLSLAPLVRDIDAARRRQRDALTQVVALYLAVTLGLVALGVAGATLLSGRVVGPLKRLSKTAQVIASGDLDLQIPSLGHDEVGALARNFDLMRTGIKHLLAKTREQGRMDNELRTAQAVQRALIPAAPPAVPGLEIASSYHPATEIGGDWYGFLEHGGGQSLHVLIGDVTGHGAPAALVTACAFAACELLGEQARETRAPLGPRQILGQLDRVIRRVGQDDILMTFFAAHLDPQKHEVRFANAGHPYPLHVRPGAATAPRGERLSYLVNQPSDMLGWQGGRPTDEEARPLERGDFLVFYTDGLVECEDAAGHPFGERSLRHVLAGEHGNARELHDRILERAFQHFGDSPRKDDITLVVVRVTA